MKIFLYGIYLENNFGGPSLLHGAYEIIKKISPESSIVFYQNTDIEPIIKNDFNFKISKIPYQNPYQILIDLTRNAMKLKIDNPERQTFIDDIKTSDVIANLYGICFCSDIEKEEGYLKNIAKTLKKFSINIIGRFYGIKSVKCTSSYGPIRSRAKTFAAKLSTKYIFDVMIAREAESKIQLEKLTKKIILISPDLANFWEIKNIDNKNKTIGISVSHQIIKQWKSNENYADCMAKTIDYIIQKTDSNIVIIPNEITSKNFDDIDVANQIYEKIKHKIKANVIDTSKISSTNLKKTISTCSVLIASRYHSCVAALSSNVPVLVIGWHYKYEELLSIYGQEKWIISNANCSSQKIIALFDSLWESIEEEKKIIELNKNKIKDLLISSGKIMFMP